jgi:general stress protein 26
MADHDSDKTHADQGTEKVAELVHDAHISMFTTMTDGGKHVSRPMALQSVEFDGDLWFFTDQDSAKVQQISAHPEVNVSFINSKQSQWTSVSGTASVVHDRAKAEELWSPALEVWFSDGLDTPGLTLIKVDVESAEFWESSSSKVVQLIGAVRAAVTGDPDKFPGGGTEVTL